MPSPSCPPTATQHRGRTCRAVQFDESSYVVFEPDGGATRIYATLTVELSQTSSQTVTVQYATADHTAKTATQDYIAASGTLYFSPGTTERTISVTVLNDTKVELTEQFKVQLTSPTNAVLGSDNLTRVSIRDVDKSAPFNLTVPATVREGQGTFTIVIEAANPPAVEHTLTFNVFSISGSALQNHDFEPFQAYAEWGDGTNRREFEVTLIDDTTDEPNETFEIKMSRTQQEFQFVMGVTQQTVTILDDDPATPTNLEIIENRTDPDLDHVAVLQWDYSDAEGYLLESRDGTSGRLELHRRRHILLKGTHRHRHRQHHQGWSNGRQLQLALQGQELHLTGILLPRRGHLRRERRLRLYLQHSGRPGLQPLTRRHPGTGCDTRNRPHRGGPPGSPPA